MVILRSFRSVLAAFALLVSPHLASPAPVAAQAPPSPADVLGWEMGERFTDVYHVQRYMHALAEASELVSVHPYGETNEGRTLIQVLVASEAHRGRLEQILAENQELRDPDTSPERAAEIIASNPGVAYFSYGVHGNESSSSEAAMWTAWDLASGSDDTAGVLDSLVVVLDPMVNPDGRDRYVNSFRQARGKEPNYSPQAREHREPWPGGRYNHYLFDLNRDWAWMSQVETRARLATWDRWTPLVHVDFHEMGWQSEYFFFPAAKPINPIYPEHILEWGERFGAGNAEAFDAEGWLYFTRQNFDLFYPGYGDSWPSLNGAIGMTYEQAGGGFGALGVDRPDGTTLTLRDRALHHRTAGKATLRTAAYGKTDLMSGFAAFHRTVDEGFQDVLLVPGDHSMSAHALVGLLTMQGIEVEVAGEPFSAGTTGHPGFADRSDFPAGTFRVRPRQPRGRLAMALLWPEFFLDAEFSYDISAWSLPYAYGVEAHVTGSSPDASWSPVGGEHPTVAEAPAGGDAARYGYLLRPDFASAPGLVNYLEGKGIAHAVTDTFTLAGVDYPRGTVFMSRGFNPDLDQRVADAGLTPFVEPIRTGVTERGPDLGSGDRIRLTLPRVALLSADGTSPTSMGTHWHFLEHRLDIPFDAIRVQDLANLDMTRYDVLIAPSGNVRGVLGDRGMEALEEWVREGGTLVAVDGSARALGSALLETEMRESEEELEGEAKLEQNLRTRDQRDLDRWLEDVPGTIVPVTLDPTHPLAFGAGADGMPNRGFALSGGTGFEPGDDLEAVAYFPEGLERISGVISQENLDRLAQSAWIVHADLGQGNVILFADDPLFRSFWYKGFHLFTNALLFGPGM
jgi:hypothetical protein